jgi:hypothetical protein
MVFQNSHLQEEVKALLHTVHESFARPVSHLLPLIVCGLLEAVLVSIAYNNKLPTMLSHGDLPVA